MQYCDESFAYEYVNPFGLKAKYDSWWLSPLIDDEINAILMLVILL